MFLALWGKKNLNWQLHESSRVLGIDAFVPITTGAVQLAQGSESLGNQTSILADKICDPDVSNYVNYIVFFGPNLDYALMNKPLPLCASPSLGGDAYKAHISLQRC